MSDSLKVVVGIATFFYTGPYAWLVQLAGSALISSAFEVDQPKEEEGIEGALRNQNSNKAPIPVVYGTRRVGGTRVFLSTRGSKNTLLDMVLVVSEGPIKGFRSIYLDDAWAYFEPVQGGIPSWIPGTLRKIGKDQTDVWTRTYNINDLVFYNNRFWIATALSHDEVPMDGSSFWDESDYAASTLDMLKSDGTTEAWYPGERNKIYLDVDDVTGFDVNNYIHGSTSGATARIHSIDVPNDRIYIHHIQPNVSSDQAFSASEVVTERTLRDSGPTGTTATGLSPMVVEEPQYFQEDTVYTVSGEQLPTSSSKLAGKTQEYNQLVRLWFHNGSADQASDTNLTSVSSAWTSDHRLRGKAYIHAQFTYDKDKLTNIPQLTALIDGIEVYDPRASTQNTLTLDGKYTVTNDGGITNWSTYLDGANPVVVGKAYEAILASSNLDTDLGATGAAVSEHDFSSNPALCIYDYLSNEYYGRGIDSTSLDTASFIATANYADEILEVTDTEYEGAPTGNTKYEGTRYNTHAVLNTDRTIFENIKSLLLSMRGFLVFSNGLYKLLADKETSSYHTFDERNIIGGISASLGDKKNTFNEIKLTYPNPLKNWESDDVVYFSDTIKDTLDNGLPLQREVSINTIANQHQALYIALQELKQSRQQIAIQFKTGIEGLLVEAGDVVRMRSLHYGWGTKTATIDGETVNVYNTRAGANIAYHEVYASGVLLGDDANPMYKEFRVLSVSLNDNLDVEISALEYDPTVYTTVPASITDYSPNTNMSDTRVALPPENLAASEYLYVSKNASGFKAGIRLTWDSSDSPWDSAYEISTIDPHEEHHDLNAYSVGTIVFLGDATAVVYRCVTAVPLGVSAVPGTGNNQTTTTSGLYYTVTADGGETDWSPLFGATGNPVVISQTYLATATSGDIDVTLGATGALVRETYWDALSDEEAVSEPKVIAITEDRDFNIRDAIIGWYVIQVRTINVVGRRSTPTEIGFEVIGLSRPPAKPTGLGILISNDNAVLTWDKATDLDVLVSGSVKIKHNPITDLSGLTSDASLEALWQNSTVLTEGKSGATTQVFLPLLVGTYLVKFIDAGEIPSESPAYVINTITPSLGVTFVTSFSELTDFTTASFDGLTAPDEDRPGYTTSGLEKITHDSVDKLQFTTTAGTTFGDPPIVESAEYYLHNAFYFDKLVDAQFAVDTNMSAYFAANLVSAWTDIDTLTSIDDEPISSDVAVKIATTLDDPTDPLAVWSDYFTFLTGSVKCHGARAAISLASVDGASQVLIEDIIFTFRGKARTEIVNDLQWTTADYNLGYKDVYYIEPFFDGAGILGADPVVPILNITLNSSLPGITTVVSHGTQVYAGGPGTNGPVEGAGFRMVVGTSSALNTTSTIINSIIDFGYQATGY